MEGNISMARPIKASEEQLKVLLPLRVRESEAKVLKELANLSHLTLAKYLRNKLLYAVGILNDADDYRNRSRSPRSARMVG